MNLTPPILFVQLCALNEQATIGDVIRRIPRYVAGVATVRVLVLDDGSTDGTGDEAYCAGADLVIRHERNQGLARSFQRALCECLAHGATYIVHLDADGQHHPEDIPAMLAPLLTDQADLVVGDRPFATMTDVSPYKRWLERLGSLAVRWITRTSVQDAVCGFRAYTRATAAQLRVTNTFSYTLETLMQAGAVGLRLANVPIASQAAGRASRLCRSTLRFMWRQGCILVRAWAMWSVWRIWLKHQCATHLQRSAILKWPS